MTINEKIYMLRTQKGVSYAELAFKVGCSIDEIKKLETKGTKINGYTLLQVLSALNTTIEKFESL
jgi:transcriptional regulator with XRE-family HTH domain